MLENIRKLANPYDFANPVSDESLFFGRSKELTDVSYYLDQAKLSKKPIHLAFVGARAAGKTSFLNISENEARKRNFCTVRINLNEGDVQSELSFFRKLFHSILNAAFTEGAFGGKSGHTYFAYFDMISRGEISDIEEMPFLTPILITRALKAKNNEFHVADDIFFDDLKLIYSEINRPIVILFDECNVLSSSRIIVEKLRNIFMNLQGFMLILAATDEFFPVIDEVFSPIMRQFKKIEIGPFKSRLDVDNCIMYPLREAGFPLVEAKKLVSYAFLKDVDLLSGRRPYEIQLICHTMFRRCQEGFSRRFALDLKTIENIQNEIASSQNSADRPNLRAARLLKRKFFTVLETICGLTDQCKPEELWNAEFLFHGNSRWTEHAFHIAVSDLIKSGLAAENAGSISFTGDDFDRLYIKYIARQKESILRTDKIPYEQILARGIRDALGIFPYVNTLPSLSTSDYVEEISDFMSFIECISGESNFDGEVKTNPVFEQLFDYMIQQPQGTRLGLAEVFVTSSLGSVQTWFYWTSERGEQRNRSVDGRLQAVKDRSVEVGFDVAFKIWDFTVPDMQFMLENLITRCSDGSSEKLGRSLAGQIYSIYLDNKQPELALKFAAAAHVLCKTRKIPQANNIGYLYMSRGDYPEAELWLLAASEFDSADAYDPQLTDYNLAITYVMLDRLVDADQYFDRAINAKIIANAACSLVLKKVEGKLIAQEVERPSDLKELAIEGRALVKETQAIQADGH